MRDELSGMRSGRLGLQLALTFIGVALAAVAAANAVGALTVNADEGRILDRQETAQTQAAARGAAVAFSQAGWAAALSPVFAVIDGSGAAARVRDAGGAVVRSSPDFAAFPSAPQRRAAIISGGRRVGSIVVKFEPGGIREIITQFNAQRWRARLLGGAVGALLALAVALILAPRITAPIERLLRAARAVTGGNRDARAGQVRGFADLKELAAAVDQMADTLTREEHLRRNMVADISHELRTPIAVLQAGTEAMLDGVSDLTTTQVQSLREEVLRLGRMVDDLQRLASAEAAAMQLILTPGDLAAVAAAAADSLTDIFESSDVSLVRRLTPVDAWCDQRRMHEVITNLLTNAAKFTDAGGQVLLETWPAAESAMIRVSDTGIGIRPDDLPRVSERFFRAQNSPGVPGSGIGLAIVDELVRGHYGTLSIASEPGQGTRVTITLPRSQDQEESREHHRRRSQRG
jgi:two-component system sensor histidine kinase BaeS